MLYTLSFTLAVLSLAGWFLLQQDETWSKRLRLLLLGALGFYGLSVATATGALDYKLGVAFRDFLFIAFSGLGFMYFAKLRKAFWIGALLLAGALGVYFQFALAGTFPVSSGNTLDEEAELLVEIPEGADISSLEAILAKYELSAQRAFSPADPLATELDDYLTVDIPTNRLGQLPEIKKAFWSSGLIDWLEENEQVAIDPMAAGAPPTARGRFGLNDPGLEQQWGFDATGVSELFDLLREQPVKPRRKALIAILDTGVDSRHEDIAANFKSTQSKYDDDPQGHGTHCAGIAAAVSNNGVGVASLSIDNSFVSVTSIKVLNASGMGTQRSIISGIIEAADQGADVISLSLGGRSNQSKQTAYKKAVEYANQKGAIVVVAAGNSNRNAKDYAPVNAPGVIGVSAVDPEIQRASFSNYVTDIPMAVAAPGVQIYSTIPGGKYAAFNGTSMATPYVSGLVGLLKSIRPELTTREVYEILQKTGKKTQNTKETGRLVQPAKALGEIWD